MAWKLKLIEYHSLEWFNRKPGDMWFCEYFVEDITSPDPDQQSNLYTDRTKEMYVKAGRILSPNYLRDWWGKRPPINLRLPDNSDWCPDAPATNNPNGWTVTGEVPNITVRASILTDRYHGWITNGEISDDTDGRTYG